MKKRKMLSVLLTLVMVFTMLAPASAGAVAYADTVELSGGGTVESPYEIANAEQLKLFRDKVNLGGENLKLCARLTGDVELGSEEWIPIGKPSGISTSDGYKGSFDGAGHSISGIKISNFDSNDVGLFRFLNDEKAIVKNLVVKNAVITSEKDNVGGIVGNLVKGTVENCSFDGTVNCNSNISSAAAGGIVGACGMGNQNIYGCVNKGNINGPCAGGILGKTLGRSTVKIDNSYNRGTISGRDKAGGIVAYLQSSKSEISNCYNIGEISGKTAGAVAGFAKGSLKNCYWTKQEKAVGGGNIAQDSESSKVSQPSEMAAKLVKAGSPFAEDKDSINEGFPVLNWQKAETVVPKNPKIEIMGTGKLYMRNSGAQPITTLTVTYVDMDDTPEIRWTIESGSDLLEPCEGGDNKTAIYKVKDSAKGGVATIKAETVGNLKCTATKEIEIIPHITICRVSGIHAVGETLSAKVFTFGGYEYDHKTLPDLGIQWKYLTPQDNEIYIKEGKLNLQPIIGANTYEYTIDEKYKDCYITYEFWFDKETRSPSYGSLKPVVEAEAAKLYRAYEALDIDRTEIRENKQIVLPLEGIEGTKISWTSDNEQIINNKGQVVLPKEENAEVMLTATISAEGLARTVKRNFKIVVISEKHVLDENTEKTRELEKKLGKVMTTAVLYPDFDKKDNILKMVQTMVKENDTDNAVTTELLEVKETNGKGGAAISSDGEVTYFFKDPNGMEPLWFGRFEAKFAFRFEDVKIEKTIPVIVYWDRDKVKEAITKEIIEKIKVEDFLSKGDTPEAVVGDLALPKVIDNKKWATITWQSADENTISISNENQTTADTLFNPYVGKVKPSAADKEVTLTARIDFRRSNDIIGNEKPLEMFKTYRVKVKAVSGDIVKEAEKNLEAKIEAGFKNAGVRDALTGEALKTEGDIYLAYNDILLPKTGDFGVDGKYYPVRITSKDSDVILTSGVNNAARVTVLRPLVGEAPKVAEVTLSIQDKKINAVASKTIKLKVMPLMEEEIQAEKALMKKAVAEYFDGIKNQNTDARKITTNLRPFYEAYLSDGKIIWINSNDEKVHKGIVPTPIDGWQELEAWRIFKSGNPAVITHENLLVDRHKENKAVTVESYLSSEALGKYGELYKKDPAKYEKYKDLADLYYQRAYADLIVSGTNPTSPDAVAENISATFTLKGMDGVWIEKAAYKDMPESTTAFDIFKKALADNGYTYKARGSYIYEITKPDGTALAEKDAGKDAGWMYTVNGKFPLVYMASYGVKDSDHIEFFYVKNYVGTILAAAAEDEKKEDDKKTEEPVKVVKIGEIGKIVKSMKLSIETKETKSKKTQVRIKVNKNTLKILKDLRENGYEVRYKFYRSTSKTKDYKAVMTKTANTYYNTKGVKGTKYYYKAKIQVLDKNGRIVLSTKLIQCRDGNILWTGKGEKTA